MPRPKPNGNDLKQRKKRAEEWRRFRENNLLTQQRMADAMSSSVGPISRRTIQLVEMEKITPRYTTLRLFEIFKKKYEQNAQN